jgi:hypothetical protein
VRFSREIGSGHRPPLQPYAAADSGPDADGFSAGAAKEAKAEMLKTEMLCGSCAAARHNLFCAKTLPRMARMTRIRIVWSEIISNP